MWGGRSANHYTTGPAASAFTLGEFDDDSNDAAADAVLATTTAFFADDNFTRFADD